DNPRYAPKLDSAVGRCISGARRRPLPVRAERADARRWISGGSASPLSWIENDARLIGAADVVPGPVDELFEIDKRSPAQHMSCLGIVEPVAVIGGGDIGHRQIPADPEIVGHRAIVDRSIHGDVEEL